MTGTIIKSCIASIFISLVLMMMIFGGITGYALMTIQTMSVFDLFIVDVSEDGMFIRISTGIWYVIGITVTFLTLLISVILLIRKGGKLNEQKIH
ncbi:hypothetical protein FZC79_18695 [Rossellomorea vietnamensis]|uniref:Uncharacterized protein n=1 Tax=Rossellomorea vietnamensis TaxID=218284 RepID=A0A5D4K7Y2_9BACI|nr:hypothetical protein [Rossellomorea vietnamensis]TYR73471.1 hypothetical protein FZC79_18695 [Rossellomorea vietnamensis]